MKKLFKNKIFKGVVGALLCVCILLFAAVIGINAYMISFSKKNFVTVDEKRTAMIVFWYLVQGFGAASRRLC